MSLIVSSVSAGLIIGPVFGGESFCNGFLFITRFRMKVEDS